jgi:hypothetical protein
VRASKASRPAAAVSANEPRGSDRLGDLITADAKESQAKNQPDADRRFILSDVLESARFEQRCSIADLTVLSPQIDPYRHATLTNQADARWAVEQLERAYQPDQRVHVHGLHYALVVQGNVRKPDGTIYINTEEDDIWLGDAIKAARWLGLLDFKRINDRRNNEPVIYRNPQPAGSLYKASHASASWDGQWTFELGEIQVIPPLPVLGNFYRDQPYALVIFCEKASGEDVLQPIAERYEANLYVGAGETSNTHVYGMARTESKTAAR